MPSRRQALRRTLPILVLLVSTGCREEGEITIGRLRFEGVDKVDKGALTGALQTRAGSRLPWGRKRFFDRSAFEADLRRIEVFYRDRGFPDAREKTQAVLRPERVRGGSAAHRGVLPRPRLSRRACPLLRRRPQRYAEQGRRHRLHRRRRADHGGGNRAERLRRAARGSPARAAGDAAAAA